MPPRTAAVTLSNLTFAWPDGSVVLDQVSGTFGSGRTGLVGANGTGKSTLLRLVAGRLRPTSGSVVTSGVVDYLPQDLAATGATTAGATLADLLGVAPVLAALRAIEHGDADPAHFETVGDAWDVEERSLAALAEAGLTVDRLDRPVATLSGGETVLAALVGIVVRAADVVLLDEPTNNLDAPSRERLVTLLARWRATLVVVSHDTDLLDTMDETVELRDGGLRVFGGAYGHYTAQIAVEQDAARQALRTAEQALATERRQRQQLEQRVAHAERSGRTDRANRRFVPAAIDMRVNAAQKSAGARRGQADAKVAAAQAAVVDAEAAVRADDRVVIDLPDPRVPAGRRIAALTGTDARSHIIAGPERVALSGPNGVGKTTLLRCLLADEGRSTERGTKPEVRPSSGASSLVGPGPVAELYVDRVGYLPQLLDGLDDDATVLAAVRAAAPTVAPGEVRRRLARFHLRGDQVDRLVGSLSGGERFRVAMARLMLAEPPADLLVLDEPTNSLDLVTQAQLVDALGAWRGALLVVSHDRAFLDQLDLDVELTLDAAGVLTPATSGHR
ncbi:MAG: ATP-binding cassette domain-containing protein [Micrococcales bacterium]|nr:ATP-binding cassette domain-containing protein [Micrococcales bacterium]